MTTEIINYNGVLLDVTYDYSKPERDVGWGGNLTLEEVRVSGSNVDIMPVFSNDTISDIEDFLFELN